MPNPRPTPYPGPRPFQKGETLHGRQRETAELLDLLIAERIVLLSSPSGAGKTSLVQAGLLPALETEGFRVLPVMRPGLAPEDVTQLGKLRYNRYVLSLLLGLEKDRPQSEQTPLAELAAMTLAEYLLARWPVPEGDDWHGDVLLFDQFEEVLTVDPTDREAKAAFFEQVGQALRDRGRWALFSMREEFVAGLDPYLRPIPARFDKGRRYRLDLLGPDAAREAMQAPAASQNVTFTDDAARRLADDLRRVQVQQADGSMLATPGPFVEPVQLQVVCLRLWENLAPDDRIIDLDDLEAVGDVDTALAGYYAATMARAAAQAKLSERALREWVDRQLITEGGIRGQVLMGAATSQGLANAAIWPLVDSHLVRAEQRRGATWFELAHDRLIAPVRKNNAEWFERNLSTLQRQAALWQQQQRPDGLLLSGAALSDAEAWAAAHEGEMEPHEAAFLAECRKAREQAERERRQSRRIRMLALAATAVAIVAFVAAFFGVTGQQRARTAEATAVANANLAATREAEAVAERKRADEKATEADEQRAIAVERQMEADRQAAVAHSRQFATVSSKALADNQYEAALLLSIEAGRATTNLDKGVHEAFDTIRAAIARPGRSMRVFYGHLSYVSQAVWSRDESRILTYGGDGTARILDSITGIELVRFVGHTNGIREAMWSHDESKVLTASDDDTVRVWNAATGGELVRLTDHGGDVYLAIWNHDESKILTASEDSTVRIWNAVTGAVQGKLEGHEGPVYRATWSQDESRVLTAGYDGTARIWDAFTGAELVRFVGHTNGVHDATWSHDESKILTTGGDDGTARIWNATTGVELLKLEGHAGWLWQATWNRDESKVLTAGIDDTARIWSAATGAELVRLSGHGDDVYQAVWSQDESRILTASEDRTARIWEASTGAELIKLADHNDGVKSAAWSQDGTKILTASDDRTARIWDSAVGSELPWFVGHGGPMYQATWSQDESKILTSSEGFSGSIWDATTGSELVELARQSDLGGWATWSHDESKVLIGGWAAYYAYIFNAITGTILVRFDGVNQVMWNQNESKVLTASGDGTARIYNASNGTELVKFMGHEWEVYQAVWSQDESKVLTASADHTARIWNAADGTELVKLIGHEDAVCQAVWSQDESKVLTYSADGTARIWDAYAGTELIRFKGHRGSVYEAKWSLDETKVLTRGSDITVRIWSALTGAELVKLANHEAQVYSAQWSESESKVLTASADGTARIWNASTGEEQVKLAGHLGGVRQATWNRDESEVLTASDDNTARIWDAMTGIEIEELKGHTGAVLQATYSQDESKVLTASADGTARIWYIDMADLIVAACRLTPRNLSWDEWNRLVKGSYRPTCMQAPIPPDAIDAVRQQAADYIGNDDLDMATSALEQINGWLNANGQLPIFGMETNSFVCQYGTTQDQAALVLDSCETAVSLAPTDGDTRNYRGLARALTGNVQGAIEDFEFVLAQAKAEGRSDDFVSTLANWIESLSEGQDPAVVFDAVTLEGSREE